MGNRFCKNCGEPIISEYNMAKYCPICSELRMHFAKREQLEFAQRAKLKNLPRAEPKEHKTLSEIAAEANAAGMTYGQYVAMRRY